MREPQTYFQDKSLYLDQLAGRLAGSIRETLFRQRVRAAALDKDLRRGLEKCLSRKQERFARLAAALDAMSPLKVLGRGYAIAQKRDGSVISSARNAQPGEYFSLRLSDGSLTCRVEGTEEKPGAE